MDEAFWWPDISGWYESGASFAETVQAGLAEGKTFDEMGAYPPEQAARIRDVTQDPELRAWWDGYVSKWD